MNTESNDQDHPLDTHMNTEPQDAVDVHKELLCMYLTVFLEIPSPVANRLFWWHLGGIVVPVYSAFIL